MNDNQIKVIQEIEEKLTDLVLIDNIKLYFPEAFDKPERVKVKKIFEIEGYNTLSRETVQDALDLFFRGTQFHYCVTEHEKPLTNHDVFDMEESGWRIGGGQRID